MEIEITREGDSWRIRTPPACIMYVPVDASKAEGWDMNVICHLAAEIVRLRGEGASDEESE